MNNNERIIIALDGDYDSSIKLIDSLDKKAAFYKLNSLFISNPSIISYIKEKNAKIFLDLKFHDIPNTVSKHIKAACTLGVDMITVHTFGGMDMMKAAARTAEKTSSELNIKRPLILGVTILTSIDQQILNNELSVKKSLEDEVIFLAENAKKAGLDGIVCSPKEVSIIKKRFGKDFITVTPGIRPKWAQKNDQKRVATPEEALKDGADYLVIGRAITNANDPVYAFERLF